jgi:CheY-like chemotaxis protein
MARVTVLNDSAEFLDMIGDILEDQRYPVTLVDGDEPEPLERIRESRPELLMIDLRLGTDKLHGWDIAQQVRHDRELARVPILICSADVAALTEIEDQLDDTRLTAMLAKPFQIEELLETVERLLGEPTAR